MTSDLKEVKIYLMKKGRLSGLSSEKRKSEGINRQGLKNIRKKIPKALREPQIAGHAIIFVAVTMYVHATQLILIHVVVTKYVAVTMFVHATKSVDVKVLLIIIILSIIKIEIRNRINFHYLLIYYMLNN